MTKPLVAGLKVSFGLVSMEGNVVPAKRSNSKDSSFKMACPVHPDTPHGVSQRYVCSEDPNGDPFLPADALRFMETDDGPVLVTPEVLSEARETALPAKTLDLQSHPYDPSMVYASGTAHVLVPAGPQQLYDILLRLMDDRGVIETDKGPQVLVGLVAYKKNSESFVRVDKWNDRIILRELVRPEDLGVVEVERGDVDTKLLDMARELVGAQSQEFDSDAYKASQRDRIAALVEQAKDGKVDVQALKPSPKNIIDITQMLEASIKQAKEAKKPKRKKAAAR